MNQTRLKIAVACLFVMAVVAAGVLILVSVIDAGPADVGDRTPDQKVAAAPERISPATAPTSTYSNAADAYREAAALLQPLSNAEQLSHYVDGYFDKDAPAFFAQHARIGNLIRAAAASPSCDWGEQIPDARTGVSPIVTSMRSLNNFTMARARFEQSTADHAGAADDVLAAMALARRVGNQPVMTNKLVEIAMETGAIKRLAVMLPAFPQPLVASLPARLDALPQSVTGQALMLAESEAGRKRIREQDAGIIATSMADSLEPLYKAVIDAWDKPQAEFVNVANAELAKMPLNVFAKQIGPSLIRIHENFAVIGAHRAMLHTAIDVQLRGESAVADSHDPLGSGPFGYSKTAKGFELISAYKLKDQSLKLVVGE